MELVRRKSDYALRSLIFMAGFSNGQKFNIKTISKKQKIPLAFLKKIFQRLARRQIVASLRGPNGGYYLSKKPQNISLKEILESVQGRISLSDCLFDGNFCSRSKSCSIKTGLSVLEKKLVSLLDKYTLMDFLR